MKLTAAEAWDSWKDLAAATYVLAPMVNASELPFRMLCRRYGCGLTYTPMYHARLFAEDPKYRHRVDPPIADPVPLYRRADENVAPAGVYPTDNTIVQFCANDVASLVSAAKLVEDTAAAVDLNCGCPQGIARRGQYGSELLKNPDQIVELVRALVEQVKCPVTVKIRVPDADVQPPKSPVYDEASFVRSAYAQTFELVKRLEELGVMAICLHARTKHNKGQAVAAADWVLLKHIVAASSIPIIANGSVASKEEADACLAYTGAAAVMSAEALLEDPSVFCDSGRIDVDVLMQELVYIYETGGLTWTGPLKAHAFRCLYTGLCQHTDLRDQLAKANSLASIKAVVDEMALRRAGQASESKLGWYRRHRQKLTEPSAKRRRLDSESTSHNAA